MIITDTAAGVRLITDPGVNVPLTDLERADYLARHPYAADLAAADLERAQAALRQAAADADAKGMPYRARALHAAARIVRESSGDHGAARTVAPVADLAAMDTEDLCDWRQREITEAREIAAALDAEDLAAATLADAVATIAGAATAAVMALDALQEGTGHE